jgi:hypothetical protein
MAYQQRTGMVSATQSILTDHPDFLRVLVEQVVQAVLETDAAQRAPAVYLYTDAGATATATKAVAVICVTYRGKVLSRLRRLQIGPHLAACKHYAATVVLSAMGKEVDHEPESAGATIGRDGRG